MITLIRPAIMLKANRAAVHGLEFFEWPSVNLTHG